MAEAVETQEHASTGSRACLEDRRVPYAGRSRVLSENGEQRIDREQINSAGPGKRDDVASSYPLNSFFPSFPAWHLSRLPRACPHVVVDDLKILRVGHAIEVEVVGARQTPRGIDRRVVGHVLRVNHAVAIAIARTCNLREASVPDLDYWTLAIKESKDPSPVPRRAATTFLETL